LLFVAVVAILHLESVPVPRCLNSERRLRKVTLRARDIRCNASEPARAQQMAKKMRWVLESETETEAARIAQKPRRFSTSDFRLLRFRLIKA